MKCLGSYSSLCLHFINVFKLYKMKQYHKNTNWEDHNYVDLLGMLGKQMISVYIFLFGMLE